MFASLAFFEFFLIFFTFLERIEFFTVPATPCPVDSAAFYPVKQAAPRRARHLLAKIHVSFPIEAVGLVVILSASLFLASGV